MQMRRRTLWLLAISLLAGLALVIHTLLDDAGWRQRRQLRSSVQIIEKKNRETKARIERLSNEVRALRDRPSVQERAVRHELGYIKPGDVVVDVPPAPTAPPTR